MKIIYWLRLGIYRCKWFLLSILGIVSISLGMLFVYKHSSIWDALYSAVLIIPGCILIYISIQFITSDLFYEFLKRSSKYHLGKDRSSNFLHEKKISVKGPRIVAIGGGTGLSTMLRGLKSYSSNITAVVTVADDGGGSGILRQDLGMLPPGDIRNCILALADTEPIMEKLLQYRFQDGMLKGQNFGNLFLAAMDGISSSFEEAVRRMSDVLAVTGKVLPVTLQDVKLGAELEDGYIIHGESNIGKHNDFHRGLIKRVFLEPKTIKPLKEAIDAILEADAIVLGPGSLYTSIIPNLLVDGICDAIKRSNAVKIYVCNVMTQPGETGGYTVSDHIKAIEGHSYKGIIGHCIANTADIPCDLRKKYMEDGASTVRIDLDEINNMGIKIIGGDYVCINNNYIRHDTKRLAQTIIDLVVERVFTKDKKRTIGYCYVKDKLKKLVG
ncbi:MAG: gluconeogenesis factor YvcK family protein [Bacillota bacterium]